MSSTKNERKTENLVREALRKQGYYDDERLVVDEQKSDNKRIAMCLRNASKNGSDGKGAPEFIIASTKYPDFVVVIECKADPALHETEGHADPVGCAVDGAIHYGKHLSKRFNVLAIGVSGQTRKDQRISCYLFSKGSAEYRPLLNLSNEPATAIESFETLHLYAARDPGVERQRVRDLMGFARELHNFMRDYAKVSETEKPLLISGVLIALQSEEFRAGFDKVSTDKLPQRLYRAIKDVIEDADIPQAKKDAMLQPYSFISAHPELARVMKGTTLTPLQKVIGDVAEHVFPFIANVSHDVVGQFYGEFLRYTGGDKKGLGIVLTPKHVTELFCDLADLSVDDVVLDTCCGTAGYLIASMHDMLRKATTLEKREHIRKNQLVGVEQQPNMFALAASNMILRGDGKANLFQESCFDANTIEKVKAKKPTIGLINPPYSQKGEGLHEFNFIETMLECLQPNGTGIAIVPLGCAVGDHPMKARLLEKHTLDAVMSMPEKLFYPVGTVTCIMVFKAHRPHPKGFKTWFGIWKDDGYVQTKLEGRADYYGRWPAIKAGWLGNFRDRAEILGLGLRAAVSADDEWCAEAYVETDYSKLTKTDFEREAKKYFLFLRKQSAEPIDEIDEEILLAETAA